MHILPRIWKTVNRVYGTCESKCFMMCRPLGIVSVHSPLSSTFKRQYGTVKKRNPMANTTKHWYQDYGSTWTVQEELVTHIHNNIVYNDGKNK